MKHLQMFAIGRSLNSGFGKRREKNEKKSGKRRESVCKPWCFYLSTQCTEVEPVVNLHNSENQVNSIQVNSIETLCAMRGSRFVITSSYIGNENQSKSESGSQERAEKKNVVKNFCFFMCSQFFRRQRAFKSNYTKQTNFVQKTNNDSIESLNPFGRTSMQFSAKCYNYSNCGVKVTAFNISAYASMNNS